LRSENKKPIVSHRNLGFTLKSILTWIGEVFGMQLNIVAQHCISFGQVIVPPSIDHFAYTHSETAED
jgi:hypothetical protein